MRGQFCRLEERPWIGLYIVFETISVARGGARDPPIGLWSMQNRTFLVLLRPIFGEKLKTAPQRKLGAKVMKYMSWFGLKKRLNFRFWPKNQSQISVKIFFFLRSPVFGQKKRLNFRFWPKNQSQFRWRPFFLEITCFWAEKTFEFPRFSRNSVSIFRQTVLFWFKNNENSDQGCLHFSHFFKKAPPPPFPNPGYAPVWDYFVFSVFFLYSV